MASSGSLPTPRRSKTMPTEGHMTKFLYSILKQLDLKPIDWSQVATELEISNGHAARMRYSRFKQQMEGTVSVARTAAAVAKQPKKTVGKGDVPKSAKLGKTTISSGKGKESPGFSKKRGASEQMVKHETNDSRTPVLRRQQMGESLSSSSSSFSLPQNRMMAPNGMMLSGSNINSNHTSNNSSTHFLSSTPYTLPLRSPTAQMSMNPDEMMMMNPHQHHHQQPPSHPHYPYGSYGSINSVGYSYNYNPDPFVPNGLGHHEYCFSGCCNPPSYPSTPNMYPGYPATLSTPSTSSTTPFASQQQQIHPQLLQPQNVWVPVKQEGGDGVSDELLVKVEAEGEAEMRVEE